MGTMEIVLIVCAVLTPAVAILFLLPKKLKKHKEEKKVVETQPYKPEVKEEPKKEEPKQEPKEVKPVEFSLKDDLVSYREYLKRKNLSSKPSRIEIGKGSNDLTEDYRAFMERINKKNKKEEVDISGLSDEMKALLVLNILDRKE